MIHRLLPAAVAAVFVAALVGACTSSPGASGVVTSVGPSASARAVASASPSPTASPSVAPSAVATASVGPSPSAGASASAGPSGPTQTLVDWGLIWDQLPPAFPRFPGSEPTITGGDPATATLDLPAEPAAAMTWFQAALKAAGWTIVGANGPREDGSFLIDAESAAAPACKSQISLAPLGATTAATIYVAAECPFS